MDIHPARDVPSTLPPLPATESRPEYVPPPHPTDVTSTLPTSPESKPKKSNPLNDLIDTERTYVEQLTGVIRKIAAAWSRTNLPPPELDTMFRSIESVYKANKALFSKLAEIGANPSSPKALGDLLMRWIDDLEAPYTNYCNKYCCGFDAWEPVKSNPKLPDILISFSSLNPPTSSEESVWTLDALFLLPKARLRYYRKLYNRLLKGTTAGRSDHRLLQGALERLDTLLEVLDSRQSIRVGQSGSHSSLTGAGQETIDEVAGPRTRGVMDPTQGPAVSAAPNTHETRIPPAVGSDGKTDGNASSPNKGSRDSLKIPVIELERRLSTERTLDIFTMSTKVVRLQISPPHLTFTREMRLSQDVLIRFIPKAIGTEVVHRTAHIFLLSDLLLICERMTPQERTQRGPDEADMWLCYPPLAGKVLRVNEVDGQPRALQIAIMKKEFLTLEVDSVDARNAIMKHLKECIEFSTSLPPPSKEPPPPMPSVRMLPNSTATNPNGGQIEYPNQITRHASGSNPQYSTRYNSLPRSSQELARPEVPVNRVSDMPQAQLSQGAQRKPSLHNSLPGSAHPRSSSGYPVDRHQRPSTSTGVPHQAHSNWPAPHQGHAPGPFNPHHQASAPPPAMQASVYPQNGLPHRPPSDPPGSYNSIRKSSSMHSLTSQYSQRERFGPQPPMPTHPADFTRTISRTGSAGNLQANFTRPVLPSAQIRSRAFSVAEPSLDEPSPPGSPVETVKNLGPVTSNLTAQMKCKVFLQQQHSQWKSLGSAQLKLYLERPTNVKQLVVESNKTLLISTIVLTDGVERVGKTGVAIELSDKGARTGIIYMLQLRDEASAGVLYNNLLVGSDRSG